MSELTLGSLFDGSGGFPLAGIMAGITPLWASEIEPFPIRVTTKRIPQMRHLGDISCINGADIPPVDIITFGSPCQDMSIAGRRSGLNGERSGLFYEAIRVIKEMRCASNGKKPRYIVWENVLGAFSSGNGEDFRTVLETVCRLGDSGASVPRSEKWKQAGEIVGDNFSVAWRVLDAQFWGVPQRRKRIFLVADLTAGSAGKILFECEGVLGYSETSGGKEQAAAAAAESGVGTADGESRIAPAVFENHSQDTRYTELRNTAPTVSSTYGSGGNNQPLVVRKNYDIRITSEGTRNARFNIYETETSRTIDTSGNPPDRNQGGVAVVCVDQGGGKSACNLSADKSPTLTCTHGGEPAVAYGIDSAAFDQVAGAVTSPAVGEKYIVRRLTPTECARLQGFPDDWCSDLGTEEPTEDEIAFWAEVFETHREIIGESGKPKTTKQIVKWLKSPHSDSAEYKMWGNGVCLNIVIMLMKWIKEAAEKEI